MKSSAKNSSALLRLKQDYVRLKNDPVPFVIAEPLPSNIYTWFYVITGPPESPYDQGYYMGKLVFPLDYPFRPPSIYMLTPNGRFATNTRLCLSISDFHPDTWNPTWSVSSILTGLLSFMLEDTITTGSIGTSNSQKRLFAKESLNWNLKEENFCQLFPQLKVEIQQKLEEKARQKRAISSPSSVVGRSAATDIGSGTETEVVLAANHPKQQVSKFLLFFLLAVFTATVKMVMSFLEF